EAEIAKLQQLKNSYESGKSGKTAETGKVYAEAKAKTENPEKAPKHRDVSIKPRIEKINRDIESLIDTRNKYISCLRTSFLDNSIRDMREQIDIADIEILNLEKMKYCGGDTTLYLKNPDDPRITPIYADLEKLIASRSACLDSIGDAMLGMPKRLVLKKKIDGIYSEISRLNCIKYKIMSGEYVEPLVKEDGTGKKPEVSKDAARKQDPAKTSPDADTTKNLWGDWRNLPAGLTGFH
ncbi:MAG: hypothetical protein WC475_04775, partial [Candidatus Paceibacterota bacterium]